MCEVHCPGVYKESAWEETLGSLLAQVQQQTSHCYLASLLLRHRSLLSPAVLCDGCRTAEKTASAPQVTARYRSLLLGSAVGSVREHGLSSTTGPFWRFSCAKCSFASLPLRSFSTPGYGASLHRCMELGNRRRNRKADYRTNVHLSEYKDLLLPCGY